MQDVGPLNPPNNVDDPPLESNASGISRIDRKTARSVAVVFFTILGGVLGLVAGMLAGFYGGFAVFGDAGDFTMMLITPCILIAAVAGATLGALGGVILGGLLPTNSNRC